MRDGFFMNVYFYFFVDDFDGFIFVEREFVIKVIVLKMYLIVFFIVFMFNFIDVKWFFVLLVLYLYFNFCKVGWYEMKIKGCFIYCFCVFILGFV